MSDRPSILRKASLVLATGLAAVSLQCGPGLHFEGSIGTGGLGNAFVAAVTPTSGPRGTEITVTGRNFGSQSTVTLGGSACAPVTVVSETELRCTITAHAPGATGLSVTNPGGAPATLDSAFTYRAFVYVARFDSALGSDILTYEIDSSDGRLTEIAEGPFALGFTPEGIALHPTGKYLYVVDTTNSLVVGFSLSASGALSPLSTNGSAPVVSAPKNIEMDPSGKFAFVSHPTQARLDGVKIDPNTGQLTGSIPSVLFTGTQPTSIATEASGKFVYFGTNQADGIYGVSYDPDDGTLTPLPGIPFFNGTTHNTLKASSDGKFLYGSAVGSTYIAGYSINSNGGLNALPVFNVPETVSTLALSPDESYLFANGAQVSDALNVLRRETDGSLSFTGNPRPATNNSPVDMVVAPWGGYLYSLDSGTFSLFAFSIDSETGILTPVPSNPVIIDAAKLSIAVR